MPSRTHQFHSGKDGGTAPASTGSHVSSLSLNLPSPLPETVQWIDACWRWTRSE